jgi:hypothetical protein
MRPSAHLKPSALLCSAGSGCGRAERARIAAPSGRGAGDLLLRHMEHGAVRQAGVQLGLQVRSVQLVKLRVTGSFSYLTKTRRGPGRDQDGTGIGQGRDRHRTGMAFRGGG